MRPTARGFDRDMKNDTDGTRIFESGDKVEFTSKGLSTQARVVQVFWKSAVAFAYLLVDDYHRVFYFTKEDADRRFHHVESVSATGVPHIVTATAALNEPVRDEVVELRELLRKVNDDLTLARADARTARAERADIETLRIQAVVQRDRVATERDALKAKVASLEIDYGNLEMRFKTVRTELIGARDRERKIREFLTVSTTTETPASE